MNKSHSDEMSYRMCVSKSVMILNWRCHVQASYASSTWVPMSLADSPMHVAHRDCIALPNCLLFICSWCIQPALRCIGYIRVRMYILVLYIYIYIEVEANLKMKSRPDLEDSEVITENLDDVILKISIHRSLATVETWILVGEMGTTSVIHDSHLDSCS